MLKFWLKLSMSQKRGFQIALCTQRATMPKIPKASEIRCDKSMSLGKPPQILIEQIGNPSIVVGFDLETHGWPEKSSSKGHVGTFGHFTMKDDESLTFARIVQIAWVIGECRCDSEAKSKCFLVKPDGFQVEQKATDFHGISHEIATEKGKDLKDVLNEFMMDAMNAYKDGGIVIAHQIEFDAGVIYEELGRCGFTDLQKEWTTIAKNGFCTMSPVVGRWLLQSNNEDAGPTTVQNTLRLDQMAKMIIPERGVMKRHDAECDAILCRWIFVALVQIVHEK